MPNVIHSLDAASLALLINNFFKENNCNNFYSIHDCFATSCKNIDKITELLRQIYFNIYSKDKYLLEFDKEFLDNIKKTYGEDCYDSETRTISIEKEIKNSKSKKSNKKAIKKQIKLIYPNVMDVIANDKLNFEASTYIIH